MRRLWPLTVRGTGALILAITCFVMANEFGITELRRGADGRDRQSPFYQNTDEAKANPWPNLPDPLVLRNGQKVTTPDAWWSRRRARMR